MLNRRSLRALFSCALLLGCQRTEPSPAPIASAKPTSAAVGADMCGEHGVLEAICTKCNPKLIPVFQAKGDWCKEHGLPESVCPVCHPERGGRPATDVTDDGAPADGTRIRFKSEGTASVAGIETIVAEARPNDAGLSAPVRIAYDATRLAHINARSPGVVRQLKVDIGSQVKKGDALLTIDSAGVGADRARLSAARGRTRIAEENLQRESQLEQEGISSRASLLRAQQELDVARSEQAALAASLSVLGASSQGVGGYTLTSPLAGTVTERRVNIGRFVGTEEVLLEIVDTSQVWAELDVAEPDLPSVRVGQVTSLKFDGLDGRELNGVISYLAPTLDPHTRSAKARVLLQNPDGMLRANLYGQARIAAGEARTGVAVPRTAVQRVKNVALVFVELSAGEYEARRVQLGSATDTWFEVSKGVRPGEKVVTTGSYLLKTETLKGSIGAGCCE